MRKTVIFTMILTLVFSTVGCTVHSEPDKKATESSSANAVIDITQAKELSEKTGNETVEKSTFAEKTTQPTTAETGTEKVSKEPIFFKPQQQIPSQSKILIRKKKYLTAKNLSLKSQQILFRKPSQQLNKVKNLIYRIGFLTLKITLKVSV